MFLDYYSSIAVVLFKVAISSRFDLLNSKKNDKDSGGLTKIKDLSAAEAILTLKYGRDDVPVKKVKPIALNVSLFPRSLHKNILKALKDPNNMSDEVIKMLAEALVDLGITDDECAEASAKLCIYIIRKEISVRFREMLLDHCVLTCKDEDSLKSLRHVTYMRFMHKLFWQLRIYETEKKIVYGGISASSLILFLLAKCCQECSQYPVIDSFPEVQCLMFILRSVGKEIENEMKEIADEIIAGIKYAFFNTTKPTKETAITWMEIIELHAANWVTCC